MHSTLDFSTKPDIISQQPAASSQQPIQVILAIYDPAGTYSRYAGVVMSSMFSNTQSKVNVTILHDDTLTSDNRKRFERTAERWDQSVSFLDVSEHFLNLVGAPDKIATLSERVTRGALFRLLIPELLDFPKVIYLDCDIVVRLDIAELWKIPLEKEKNSLAAVKYPRKEDEGTGGWVLPYDPENYFNSGVLLMDLAQIRDKRNFIQEVSRFFKRYGTIDYVHDEKCLNVLFRNDVLFLEKRFNNAYDYNVTDNAIIHFAGRQPWWCPMDTPRDRLFWATLTESEWSDQLTDAILTIFRNKAFDFHSIDCVKLLLRRIPKHLRLKRRCRNLLITVRELYYKWRGK